MSAFIIFLAFIWGGTMGFTLLVTRFRLTPGDASIWDQLIVRVVALFSASAAMGTLGLVVSRVSATPDTSELVPFLWLAAVIPLLAPPVKSNGVTLVSSENWIYTSVALTAVGGFILAIATLVRLIMQNPQLV